MAYHIRRCDYQHLHSNRGFSYLWTLFLVFFLGLGLSIATETDSINLRREQERELIFVGKQFRNAIGHYYEASRASEKKAYPSSLNDLIEDRRTSAVERHLRKIYIDPITGRNEWGLLKIGGRIVGIHSLSNLQPLKVDGFDATESQFKNSTKYSEWIFTYPPDLFIANPEVIKNPSDE